jgi:hypothetical protein
LQVLAAMMEEDVTGERGIDFGPMPDAVAAVLPRLVDAVERLVAGTDEQDRQRVAAALSQHIQLSTMSGPRPHRPDRARLDCLPIQLARANPTLASVLPVASTDVRSGASPGPMAVHRRRAEAAGGGGERRPAAPHGRADNSRRGGHDDRQQRSGGGSQRRRRAARRVPSAGPIVCAR